MRRSGLIEHQTLGVYAEALVNNQAFPQRSTRRTLQSAMKAFGRYYFDAFHIHRNEVVHSAEVVAVGRPVGCGTSQCRARASKNSAWVRVLDRGFLSASWT
jgi:acyl dehydratase